MLLPEKYETVARTHHSLPAVWCDCSSRATSSITILERVVSEQAIVVTLEIKVVGLEDDVKIVNVNVVGEWVSANEGGAVNH